MPCVIVGVCEMSAAVCRERICLRFNFRRLRVYETFSVVFTLLFSIVTRFNHFFNSSYTA
jgi:hypothetical protein